MLVHVLSYGEKIWLKHEEIKTDFQLGIKGLIYIITRRMQDIVGQVGRAFASHTLHALALAACSSDRREKW